MLSKKFLSLNSTSKFKVGLDYEKLSLAVLKSYSFHLKHTGGSGDGGQDFTGCWSFPQQNIPVVGQCKCWKTAVGPKDVREFEDVLYRKFVQLDWHHSSDPPSLGGQRTSHVGVMISRSWFSPAALKTFHSSKMAMIVMQIVEVNSKLNHLHLVQEQSGSHSISCPGSSELDNSREENGHVMSNGEGIDNMMANEGHVTGANGEGMGHMMSNEGHVTGSNDEEDRVILTGGVPGYVNEMVLNSKALGVVGDVQLVWRWTTEVTKQPRRQLVLTLKK